jgi:two-component system OmpR family response regulator
LGADDYRAQPFAFPALFAGVRALVRRDATPRPATLVVGELELDPATHTVQKDGQPVELTAKEFALLEYFMRYPGQALSRSRLIEHVWDYTYMGDSNVVDVYVRHLRRKIDGGLTEASLETVRGVGYRLREIRRPHTSLRVRLTLASPRGWPSLTGVAVFVC